jgi:hypothetical protein
MPKSVSLEIRNAKLSTEFGLDWATKLFGAEAIASLPILQAGKDKGRPKGYIIWQKSLGSGWCRECQSGVAVGQIVAAWVGEGPCSLGSGAIAGRWMGRVQPLCGSRTHLFQEARDRHAAEAAREAARWEEEKAEMLAEIAAAKKGAE